MSTDKLEQRKAALRVRGVPERFVEAIATRKEMARWPGVLWGAPLIVSLVAFAAYMFPIFRLAARLIYAGAPPHLLLWTGVSFILFVALLIAVVGVPLWVFGFLSRLTGRAGRHPAANWMASNLRAPISDGETLSSERLLPAAQTERIADERAYLNALVRRVSAAIYPRVFGVFAVLWLPMIALGAWVMFTYTIVTPDAVISRNPFHTQVLPLRTLSRVNVECGMDRSRADFHYRLVFPKWTEDANIYWADVSRAEALHRLSALDARLGALHVPVVRAGGADTQACATALVRQDRADPGDVQRLVFGEK